MRPSHQPSSRLLHSRLLSLPAGAGGRRGLMTDVKSANAQVIRTRLRGQRLLTDAEAPLLPALEALPSLALQVATAVAIEAVRAGVAPAANETVLRNRVHTSAWLPEYASSGGE